MTKQVVERFTMALDRLEQRSEAREETLVLLLDHGKGPGFPHHATHQVGGLARHGLFGGQNLHPVVQLELVKDVADTLCVGCGDNEDMGDSWPTPSQIKVCRSFV